MHKNRTVVPKKAMRYSMVIASSVFGLGAMITVAGSSAGASVQTSSKSPIPYCLDEPLTGPAASIGTPVVDSTQLAITKINNAGGIDGHKIVFDSLDSMGTAAGGSVAANKAVYADHCPIIEGGFAAVMLAAQAVAAPNNVLVINDGGAGTELLKKKYLWDLSPQPPVTNPPLAEYAIAHHIKKIAMIYSSDAYGVENSSNFATTYEKDGGKIVLSSSYPDGTTDFSTNLAAIESSGAQAVYDICLGQSEGFLFKQAASAGLMSKMWLGPLLSSIYSIAGNAENGTPTSGPIGLNTYAAPNSKGSKLIESLWKKTFPASTPFYPGLTDIEGYQEVMLFDQLVKEAVKAGLNPDSGKNLQAVLEKNPSTQSYFTNGTITFNLKTHGSDTEMALQNIVGDGLAYRTIKIYKNK